MGVLMSELDWALEIEGPAGYPGYRLDPNIRRELTEVSYSVEFPFHFFFFFFFVYLYFLSSEHLHFSVQL